MKDNSKFLITSGFGSIVIVMILLAVFSLSQFRSIKQAMSTLVEETNVKMHSVSTMRDTIQIRSLTLRKMQLESDIFKRDELFMKFIHYASRYRVAINTFQSFDMNEEEIAALEALKKSTYLSQPVNLEAAELLMTNKSNKKLVDILSEADQLQNDVFHWLNELVLLESERSGRALLQVNRHYKETQYLLIAMIIVAIVISILVAVMVIRNVGSKNKKIAYQTTHDRLTGLMNRDTFEVELTDALKNIKAESHESILFYMDLDHFKIVNDTCGHVAGDQLLGRLPKLFEKHKRKNDSLARLGGDEFGLLLTNCNIENAKKISEAILKEIDDFKFHWENKVFSIGISIGLVALNLRHNNINDVLSEADVACYSVKNKGGNAVKIYDISNEDIVNKQGQMNWLSNINEALKNDQFELFFQPIYPLNDTGVNENYYEVLLRYRDKSGEILPTASLLSAAERFGTVDQVDRWVIKNSFIWLKKCKQIKDVKLSINLSGQSLSDDGIYDFIKENIAKYDIDAQAITFEVTESAAVNSMDSANKLIVLLKDLGCKFSLDDFGSGYSSFRFLKNFPVDSLKIDGGFVRNIATDPVDYAMVKSIHDIGRSMGMITIAEFAETEAIVEKLREIGIDYAQGYAIAKPSSNVVAIKSNMPKKS